jgi:LCP family protein required for cell wall assembly
VTAEREAGPPVRRAGGGHHRGGAAGGGAGRRRWLALGRVVAAGVSFALLLGFGYGWYQYRSLNAGLQRLHLSNLGQAAGGSTSTTHQVNGREQNILVVGIDSRTGLSAQEQRLLKVGSDTGSLATDTVMIIHVPADGSRATMISIPRDSFVDIPGYLKNKINAAYADAYSDASKQGANDKQAQAAGANLLVKTVSNLTGLSIDHYVQVGFGGFYTIAKALGSIPVNLCQATDDTRAHNRAEGSSGGSGFKMSAGHHDLTPVQALEFVRQRHNITGGDLAREKRQRYFLAQAFNKIASAGVLLNPSKLSALIKAVTGAFYVDDNGFSLVDLANQMADLSANKITGYTIPTAGSADEQVAGQSVSAVVVEPATVQRFVQQHINPPASTPSSSPAKASTSASGSTSSAAPSPTKGCIN